MYYHLSLVLLMLLKLVQCDQELYMHKEFDCIDTFPHVVGSNESFPVGGFSYKRNCMSSITVTGKCEEEGKMDFEEYTLIANGYNCNNIVRCTFKESIGYTVSSSVTTSKEVQVSHFLKDIIGSFGDLSFKIGQVEVKSQTKTESVSREIILDSFYGAYFVAAIPSKKRCYGVTTAIEYIVNWRGKTRVEKNHDDLYFPIVQDGKIFHTNFACDAHVTSKCVPVSSENGHGANKYGKEKGYKAYAQATLGADMSHVKHKASSSWKRQAKQNVAATSGKLGDWQACTHNIQCENNCCTNVWSKDGTYKCTPKACDSYGRVLYPAGSSIRNK